MYYTLYMYAYAHVRIYDVHTFCIPMYVVYTYIRVYFMIMQMSVAEMHVAVNSLLEFSICLQVYQDPRILF